MARQAEVGQVGEPIQVLPAAVQVWVVAQPQGSQRLEEGKRRRQCGEGAGAKTEQRQPRQRCQPLPAASRLGATDVEAPQLWHADKIKWKLWQAAALDGELGEMRGPEGQAVATAAGIKLALREQQRAQGSQAGRCRLRSRKPAIQAA
ncbi:hypothetical protein ABPG75_003196 [Micractinium tetrahymenae]